MFTANACRGRGALPFLVVFLAAALAAALPGSVRADGDTCEPELTGVFLVGGIYPGAALSLDVMHVQEVGEAVWPADAEMLETVTDLYAGDPNFDIFDHQAVGDFGNFRMYYAQPMDFGAVTIVDRRDGAVVFAAGQVWMGFGDLVFPTADSHAWGWVAAPPAAEPAGATLISNWAWSDEYFGAESYLAQVAVDFIRQTDVVHSFGSCAPYHVTSFLHTPTVGSTDPSVAYQVLILSGHAGPPWGPEPIAVTPAAWDRVKALFR